MLGHRSGDERKDSRFPLFKKKRRLWPQMNSVSPTQRKNVLKRHFENEVFNLKIAFSPCLF